MHSQKDSGDTEFPNRGDDLRQQVCRAEEMSEADRSWLALINYRVLRTGRRSADGVPAFRHWNETPGKLVVVGSLRQRIESRRVGQEVLLRRNGCSHGIQQTVEFNFTHHALRVRERSISKDICGQIEVIDQIVSILLIAMHLVTGVLILNQG